MLPLRCIRILCSLLILLQGGLYGEPWAIYKGAKLPLPEAFNYDLLVLDKRPFSLLEIFSHKKTKVIGVLSISFIEKDSPYFERLKDQKALLTENKGAKLVRVNTASSAYVKVLIEEIVPKYLFDRFKGIYIKADEHSQGIPLLIGAIRLNYPEMMIILEAEPEVVAEAAGKIDGAVVTATASFYNPQEQTYALRNSDEENQEFIAIREIMKKHPQLKYYSLDFWDTHDLKGTRAIIEKQKKRGFSPYVTDYKMDKLTMVSP